MVGSNIFNIVWVLGMSAAVGNGVTVSRSALAFDVPVMVAAAVACLPVFFTGFRIARWEGALFLAYYLAYTGFLILAARQHVALGALKTAVLYFALPLTVVTLAVITWKALVEPSKAPDSE